MKHFEKELSSRLCYSGKIFNVTKSEVELENGQHAAREVVHHNGAVAIAALDEQGRLLMVRQYRFAVGAELLEIPAGKLEPGESPLQCAFRELEEETGYTTKTMSPLTVAFASPGCFTEKIHIFLALKLAPSHQNLDDDEFLTVEHVPLDEAVRMVMDGEITDAKTQIAVLMLDRMK